MQSYPCVERHGMVMIWYHPLNESPHYDAICIDELLSNEFEFRGVYRYPNIRMHLQEFAENAADVQHFQPLHGQMLIPWTEWCIPCVFVNHKASLEFDDKPYLAYFYDTAMQGPRCGGGCRGLAPPTFPMCLRKFFYYISASISAMLICFRKIWQTVWSIC
jgi:hypothetical protein